jgi:hypothetical protein
MIVSEADKGTSPLETWQHLELKPFIQHMVQEDVAGPDYGKSRADGA